MKSVVNIVLATVLGVFLFSCTKDVYDMDKLSEGTGYTRRLYMPIVKGSFEFGSLLNVDFDSFEIDGPDTIKYYFGLDTVYTDTLSFSGGSESNVTVRFANLHYWLKNSFPLGLNGTLYLYNSDQQQVIDTLPLNTHPDSLLLYPPPIDSDGFVLKDDVKEKYGVIELSTRKAENLLQNTTHIIIETHLMMDDVTMVKVFKESQLDFQLVLEGEATFQKNEE